MRRTIATSAALAAGVVAIGCGGPAPEHTAAAPQRDSPTAHARPPAPAAAGALAQIADGAAARRRLAYVNLERIGEVRAVIAPRSVQIHVLGRPSVARLPPSGARTAIALGGSTVIRGAGLQGLAEDDDDATASGSDGLVMGGDRALRDALSDARPQVSAITPAAQSAVQSCLGDAVAQTIVGPAVMGRDAAIGAGLRTSGDRPAGVQLAICVAPHLRRELRSAERSARRRFSTLGAPRARRPVIEEIDIGERDMLSVVLPADVLGARRALALLGGGEALRGLGGRR